MGVVDLKEGYFLSLSVIRLKSKISVGELICTVEYEYPSFVLLMDCFWCEIEKGDLILKEHEESVWVDEESMDLIEWLPADKMLIEVIKQNMKS